VSVQVLDQQTFQYQGVSKENVKKGILANLTRKVGL
jgi:hypothetical protein